MQSAQISSPRFSYQAAAAAPRTLDDYRVIHDNYSSNGSLSAGSMRPLLIAAVVVASIAGAAFGVNAYSDRMAAKSTAIAAGPDPSLPSAAAVQANSNLTGSVPAPSAATTAKDSPATDPMGTLTKSEAANTMPMAGQANNHSSESLNPGKVTGSVTAKSAVKPSAPAKAIRTPNPTPAPAAMVVAPPSAPVEAAPLVTPPMPLIEEKPAIVVPAPMPDAPPAEAPKL
jgi:hypothetical protein